MKVDVCYIVSHGFAARMLLQTRLLERLIDQGLRIGIIIPDLGDENFSQFVNHPNAEVREWSEKSTIWMMITFISGCIIWRTSMPILL